MMITSCCLVAAWARKSVFAHRIPLCDQTVGTLRSMTVAPCLARREGSERETQTSPPTFPLPCRRGKTYSPLCSLPVPNSL
ncbi:hypothetical protein J6590_049138 [Homalodisca vitripennis]|nr:hypothetical protein J6590_049138 [Homalodisca vitripennis]